VFEHHSPATKSKVSDNHTILNETSLSPFLDLQVQFDQKLADGKVAQPAMVPKHFGGSLEVRPIIETYKECLARRKYRAQKWSELGGTVGLSELDFLLPINI
jgi:hypothetical protein